MAHEKQKIEIIMMLWGLFAAIAVGVGAIVSDRRNEERANTVSAAVRKTTADAAKCNAAAKSTAKDVAIVRAAVSKLEIAAKPIASTSTSTSVAPAAATAAGRRNTILSIILVVGIAIVLFYGVRAVKSGFIAQDSENHGNGRENGRDDLFRMMKDALTSMNVRREGHSIVLEPPDNFWEVMQVISRAIVDESLPPDVRELLKQVQIRELLKHVQIRANPLSNRKMIYISDDFWRTALQRQLMFPQSPSIEEEIPKNGAATSRTLESTSTSDPKPAKKEFVEESDNGNGEGSDDADTAAARKYELKGKAKAEE